jgi:hypothetical protein
MVDRAIRIKGTAVLDAVRSVKQREGEPRFQEIVALLEPAHRPIFLGNVQETAWYSLDAFVEFLAASLRYSGDDEKILISRSEAVIERQLRGIYQVFVRLQSPESVIKRIVTIHRTYFDGSTITFETPERHRAVIRYMGFRKQHRLLEYVIIGFYKKVLEMAGAKHVNAQMTVPFAQGGPFGELTLTWR